MEISSGDLVNATGRSRDADLLDDVRQALDSVNLLALDVERLHRASVASIYETRRAASRDGRGPRTAGLEEFVEFLTETGDDWIHWVSFRDSVKTMWLIVLDLESMTALALLRVFDEPI